MLLLETEDGQVEDGLVDLQKNIKNLKTFLVYKSGGESLLCGKFYYMYIHAVVFPRRGRGNYYNIASFPGGKLLWG